VEVAVGDERPQAKALPTLDGGQLNFLYREPQRVERLDPIPDAEPFLGGHSLCPSHLVPQAIVAPPDFNAHVNHGKIGRKRGDGRQVHQRPVDILLHDLQVVRAKLAGQLGMDFGGLGVHQIGLQGAGM